jgi:Kelch motif
VRRVVICSLLTACLLGCGGTVSSSPPAESPPAAPSPVAVVTTMPSPSPVPLPTASPSAAATPSAVPTLTPRSSPGPDRGTWTTVKGSALVAPDAVAVPAGDRGVLLLGLGVTDGPEGCQTPERNAHGAPASFYDARTHAISRVAGKAQLQWFETASLADGRVMIAGGYEAKDASQAPTRRTRIWDPSTRRWTEGAPMGIGRSGFNLVTLSDGRLLAAGGSVACDDEPEDEGCETETTTAELYDPVTNRWTPTSDVMLNMPDGGDRDQLSDLIVLTGGQVLATGENDSAALYDPMRGTWTALAWHGGWSPIALRDGTALSFGVEYLGADGETEVPFVARSDPEGSTTIVGHFEPTFGAATAVLGDGRVFFAGGVVEDATGYAGTYIKQAEVFDPDTGQLSELAAMPAVRGASTAVPLADGSVLVVGGWNMNETVPATEEDEGNDIPGCVPVKYRVVRWVP